MRYTGSLDIQKTWERILRRASLPLAYTQGYHPQARINQASPLPLGYCGANEIIDIWLVEEVDLDGILDRIRKVSPRGIDVTEIAFPPENAPSLQSRLDAAEYIVDIKINNAERSQLELDIEGVLNSESILRTRRNKTYDLRPMIQSLGLMPGNNDLGSGKLVMVLCAQEGKTGRPDEVLQVLGIDPVLAMIERRKLIFRES
jgi:radical SAM-linked protein